MDGNEKLKTVIPIKDFDQGGYLFMATEKGIVKKTALAEFNSRNNGIIAINLDDARIQDNEGNQPLDVPIFEDGAPAYFSNLPIKAMVAKIRSVGLPASVSNTAGTFVCNHLMYGVLYHIAKSYPGVKGGFMHVPFVPSQTVNRPTPAPSMCEQDIARGIEAAIAAIAENEKDIVAAEGQTH